MTNLINRTAIPEFDKNGKTDGIKVAYLSIAGYADVDFSIVRELKKKVNLYYFIIVTPYSLKTTAINIKKQYPVSGIFKVSIYPEIEFFSENFDSEKTYIINICSHKASFKSVFVFGKLLFMLMRLNIDILHITRYYGIIQFFLYFLYKKTILTVHDPKPHPEDDSKKHTMFRKTAFYFIKDFIILNENQKDEFISTYKLKNKNIYVSKLGIYDYLQRYKNNVHVDGINDKKEYILFFGRITEYKGLDFLFPAMKLVNETHKEIKLIVAGYCQNYFFDISEYENCPYIEIRNKFIPDDELAVLIQNALFVVCPYVSATQSGVVMSSFTFNIPVLATNTGGLSDYVEHMRSGYIVEPKDINGLADGIKYLLDNRKLLEEQKLFIEKKYRIGDYSWDKITNDLLIIYKNIINYNQCR